MRYELSDGTTGSTNMTKKEFTKKLQKNIHIISWKQDALHELKEVEVKK